MLLAVNGGIEQHDRSSPGVADAGNANAAKWHGRARAQHKIAGVLGARALRTPVVRKWRASSRVAVATSSAPDSIARMRTPPGVSAQAEAPARRTDPGQANGQRRTKSMVNDGAGDDGPLESIGRGGRQLELSPEGQWQRQEPASRQGVYEVW